jgi:hypothetical protein
MGGRVVFAFAFAFVFFKVKPRALPVLPIVNGNNDAQIRDERSAVIHVLDGLVSEAAISGLSR